MKKDKNYRKNFIKDIKKAVIKVGSSVLTSKKGIRVDKEAFFRLAYQVSEVRKKGVEVVLVSSGAIACGMEKLGIENRPVDIHLKQAIAACGQTSLMLGYEKAFLNYGINVAQILLTHDGLADRKRFLNARKTIDRLLSMGIVPIVNENDSVAVEEIMFGDNDNLAALLTSVVEADLLVLLTDKEGLYDRDPEKHKDARLILHIDKVDERIEEMAKDTSGKTTVGGMVTKIQATKTAAAFGIPTIIASGIRDNTVISIFEGEEVGTLITPEKYKLSSRKHWIAFTLKPSGEIILDEGAKNAVVKGGKSVLPSGIIGIRGDFDIGDAVCCVDERGKVFAKGLTSYSSSEIRKIMGIKSDLIESVLGYTYGAEVIHRDDLAIVSG